MAGAASAHQAATASREDTSPQRAGRRQRTSAEPQRTQQGATAAAAAPAAQDNLSRLQQLADASPQVAQLRRLQALAHACYAPPAQLAGGPEEEELVQGQFASAELPAQLQQTPHANNTGLPDQLKSGIESLSGMSMDDVRVHFNSSQPAQLNALAYAQGSDIHLAPGQERHLPHEAWHVVQQAQGRVRPTLQLKDGVPVNDDVGLEREADVMGSKALEGGHRVVEAHRSVSMPIETAQPIDGDATNSPELNVANNQSAPLANGRGSAQRGGNEMQRIADQRPEAALQRQVQAWGDGNERVGQLRAWQGVADGRGVGGKSQGLTPGFCRGAPVQRLRKKPANAPVDIGSLALIHVYDILRRANPDPDPEGYEFEDGDRVALSARGNELLPGAFEAMMQAQLTAEDLDVLRARNVQVGGPEQQLLLRFMQKMQTRGIVFGFDEWVAYTSTQHAEERQDHINELWEAARRIVFEGARGVNMAEAAISGSAQTADLTIRGTQVEIKTIRAPIVRTADLYGQLQAALAKFNGATAGHYEVTLFASIDARLLNGGIARTTKGITTTTTADPTVPGFTTVISSGGVERKRTQISIIQEMVYTLNAGTYAGTNDVRRVVVVMENAVSFECVKTDGVWAGGLL